jgi:hypothetical protein
MGRLLDGHRDVHGVRGRLQGLRPAADRRVRRDQRVVSAHRRHRSARDRGLPEHAWRREPDPSAREADPHEQRAGSGRSWPEPGSRLRRCAARGPDRGVDPGCAPHAGAAGRWIAHLAELDLRDRCRRDERDGPGQRDQHRRGDRDHRSEAARARRDVDDRLGIARARSDHRPDVRLPDGRGAPRRACCAVHRSRRRGPHGRELRVGHGVAAVVNAAAVAVQPDRPDDLAVPSAGSGGWLRPGRGAQRRPRHLDDAGLLVRHAVHRRGHVHDHQAVVPQRERGGLPGGANART